MLCSRSIVFALVLLSVLLTGSVSAAGYSSPQTSRKKISMNQIRFCVGYSGWGKNQLEDELKRNSWLVSNLPPEVLMTTSPENLWAYALRNLDIQYSYWANFPTDPGLN